MNSNRYEISSQLKISLRCLVLSLCSHELRRNETKTGMDFISVIFTEMRFHTCMRFSCEQNLPEPKWISADSLDIALNVHVHLKITAGMDFISVNFREMEFHFGWLIKYHINTTRNEIPTHVHQNIELFWNVAEMKPNVNLFSHRFEIRP